MLKDTHGIKILNTLLQKAQYNPNDPERIPTNKEIVFDGGNNPIYIGLLNELPTPMHENLGDDYVPYYFKEPGPKAGTVYTEYMRLRLDDNSQLNKIFLLSDALFDEITGEVYVTNMDSIVFPEAIGADNGDGTSSGWGEIKGFGLFYNKNTTDVSESAIPFLWGEIRQAGSGEAITIASGEVPVIREGGLRISIQ